MLEPGQRVGRYSVLGLVGHGGLASVYRVRHVDLGSLHALKVLDVHRPSLRDRLLDEGRAQATIVHPNVVRVTDVLVHDGDPALVMELVDGPPLDLFLAARPRPDLGTTLALAVGMTRGLRAAHARGMVHRDLKPANVLLAPTPGGLLPKLADFGLVKVLCDEVRTLRTPTRVGSTMGTPEFMAPEQLENAAGVDSRADLYSLGCVLYLLLTGGVPIRCDDFLVLHDRIAAGDYPPPRAVVPGIPPALDRIVGRLLRPNPGDRPASCDEVLAVLESPEARVPRGSSTIHPGDLLDAAARTGAVWSAVVGPERVPEPVGGRRWVGWAAPFLVPAALAALGLAAHRPDPPPVLVAAPVAEEAPLLAEPAQEVAPTPTLAAPAPRSRSSPKTTRVDVEGDATRVWLVRDDVRHDVPGTIRPGSYQVVALFPGTAPVAAGTVVVGSERMTVRCVSFSLRCGL